jgi:hypothetical protein
MSNLSCDSAELQLHGLVKTLTRLGFDDWSGVTDAAFRSGDPQVFVRFLRFAFVHFARTTAELLAPTTVPEVACLPSTTREEPCTRYAVAHARGIADKDWASREQGALAVAAPSTARKGVAVVGPTFIIEVDDARFVQRLMTILPPRFGYRSPITAAQFFRPGFTVAKAAFARDVLGLFAARERRLRELEERPALARPASAHRALLREQRHAAEDIFASARCITAGPARATVGGGVLIDAALGRGGGATLLLSARDPNARYPTAVAAERQCIDRSTASGAAGSEILQLRQEAMMLRHRASLLNRVERSAF